MTKLEIKNQTISFAELTSTGHATEGLVQLVLDNVTLDGSEDDMLLLNKFLRGHRTVEIMKWTNVACIDDSLDLDLLISTALVSIPKLQSLSVANCNLSASALICVGYAESLKKLHLVDDTTLTDESIAKLAESVIQSKSLEEIELKSNAISDVGRHAFCATVKQSKDTSIHSVTVHNNSDTPEHNGKGLAVAA